MELAEAGAVATGALEGFSKRERGLWTERLFGLEEGMGWGAQ